MTIDSEYPPILVALDLFDPVNCPSPKEGQGPGQLEVGRRLNRGPYGFSSARIFRLVGTPQR